MQNGDLGMPFWLNIVASAELELLPPSSGPRSVKRRAGFSLSMVEASIGERTPPWSLPISSPRASAPCPRSAKQTAGAARVIGFRV